MKANELMLGDWVRRRWTCSDTGREVVKDFQVTEIRRNGNFLYAWGKNGNMGRVEDLEPIPLTAEILEGNGFTKAHDEVEDIDTYLSNYFQFFLTTDGWKWWLSIYDSAINVQNLIGIRFIHELQHALRLCGIDRDIVI